MPRLQALRADRPAPAAPLRSILRKHTGVTSRYVPPPPARRHGSPSRSGGAATPPLGGNTRSARGTPSPAHSAWSSRAPSPAPGQAGLGALQRTPSPAWAAVKAAAGAGLDAMLQHAAHAHAAAAVAAASEGQPPPPPPRISGDWYKMGVQLVRRDSEDEGTARARISAAAADGRPQSAPRGGARVSAARSAAGAAPLRVDVAAVEADSAAEAAALRSALSRPPPRASQAGHGGPSPAASPTPAGTPRRSVAAWRDEGELAPLAVAARAQPQHPPLQPRRYGASPQRRPQEGVDVRHSYASAAAMLNGGGSFVTDGHAARRTLSPGRYADRLASREPAGPVAVRAFALPVKNV